MADIAFAQPPGSAGSGLGSPTKSSPGGSRGETPGSGRSSILKNDVKRWKRMHEQNAMLRLTELRSAKKVEAKTSKDIARKIARKIPVELLAKDWLTDSEASIEMRAYMVDKVMPTLILGVEKLLNAVDERGLANPEANGGYDPNFNPVNFLAQYLFRNNPRYSNYSEASPYVHGIRQIAEELKAQLFDMEDNRLARIKAEAKRKREERELKARLQQEEKERRHQALMTQFAEWNVPTDNNRVELSMLQNALRSFMEVAEQFPPEIQDVTKFGKPLESTDETGRTLAVTEFAQYLSLYVETLPPEVFEQFMVHMSKCANAHRASAERENRRIGLTNLFIYCDHSGIGLLDRHRILNLFEQFWDVYEDTKKKLRNPRRWPVVEVDEADEMLSDDDEAVPDTTTTTTPETSGEDKEEEQEQSTGSTEPQSEKEPESSESSEEAAAPAPAPAEEAEENAGEERIQIEEPEQDQQESGEKKEGEESKEEESLSGESEKKEGTETTEESGKISEKESKESTEASAEQKESAQKTGADPELATDVDLSGEMAKSAAQSRDPQPTAAATGRVSITFAQGTAFEREKTGLTVNSGMRSQSAMSAFDESNLNVSQFVQLTETFLGEAPDSQVYNKLMAYVREGYEETEDEKMERLMKARKEAVSAKRKVELNTLFEKWDNDGSGYLDMDEVVGVMTKYKEGQEKGVIAKMQEDMKKTSKYQDTRLTKKEFRTFVGTVIDALPGDSFEYFVEFMANSVERSYAERVRGEARKKWLQNIITAAEVSGVCLDPIYKAVFQSLYRDAEAHGGEKRISANIALLEKNTMYPHRGDVLLRYTACTPEDAEYVINKALYKDMKGISFQAVEEGRPIHVPRVNTHGKIQFWNTDRMPEEREGSFIVVPLKDRKRRVFGVLGVDTLTDPHSKAIFITHEVQYFQGVAQMFSTAYHMVDMRRKLLRITESAISWIKRRSPNVTEIMVYMVEPGKDREDFVLRRMMTTDSKGFPVHMKDPPVRLERKDNLFRDYLFKSVDNSETVMADAYGNRQFAFPLRNDKGKAIAVVDINTGSLKSLPAHESKEIQRMLRLLQQAHKEITREFAGEEKTQVLEGEKNDETRMDIMFDRLMLMELRDNVSKLDSKAYAELKAYNSPPEIILHILRATLAIFYRDLAKEGEFDDWNTIKTYINSDLSQKIQFYDPTAFDHEITPSVIEDYLKAIKNVPHGEVAKHGSLPAQHMYNWVFVCLSLIEHTRKMRENSDEDALGRLADSNN